MAIFNKWQILEVYYYIYYDNIYFFKVIRILFEYGNTKSQSSDTLNSKIFFVSRP